MNVLQTHGHHWCNTKQSWLKPCSIWLKTKMASECVSEECGMERQAWLQGARWCEWSSEETGPGWGEDGGALAGEWSRLESDGRGAGRRLVQAGVRLVTQAGRRRRGSIHHRADIHPRSRAENNPRTERGETFWAPEACCQVGQARFCRVRVVSAAEEKLPCWCSAEALLRGGASMFSCWHRWGRTDGSTIAAYFTRYFGVEYAWIRSGVRFGADRLSKRCQTRFGRFSAPSVLRNMHVFLHCVFPETREKRSGVLSDLLTVKQSNLSRVDRKLSKHGGNG